VSQTEDRPTKPTPSNGTERLARPTPPDRRPNLPSRPGEPLRAARPTAQLRAPNAPTPGMPKPTTPNPNAAARSTALVRNRKRRRRIIQIVILAVALLLIGTGLLVAAVVGPAVTTILTDIGKISKTPVGVRVGPEGTPVTVLPPEWEKKEPINVLLIGLDYRPQEEDTRADTQIVVHIDLAAKTASMLSIPRDLWVNIPGFGEGRVNSSYQLGERSKDTIQGGGTTLAMSTVQQNFGIPIHYFAKVDFVGFEHVLDAMGGITIDVAKPLVDNDYPLANYGATRIYIPAGLQHMDGRTALQFARSRHADSDLGRNSRQQQVLLALKQQALSLNIVSHLTEMTNQLAGAVETDLTVLQVKSLADIARDFGPSSIQTVLLEPPLVNSAVLSSGADVLLPNWDLIRPKVFQAFGNPKLVKEAARISVMNGTTVAGLARKTGDVLTAKGLMVVNLASVSDPGKHPVTTITDYSAGTKPDTVAAIAKALGIAPDKVIEGDPADAPEATSDSLPVDIVVVVGDDRDKK
jgi:LCP family protein required for cell wall assembly